MKRTKKFFIAGTVIVVVALLIVFSFIPFSVTKKYYCPYCRAYRNDTRVLGLKTAPKIEENIVTQYWRSHIDPNHKHIWRHYSTEEHGIVMSIGCGYIDWPHYMLQKEAEIAILQSFRTPTARDAFIRSFLVWDINQSESTKSEWRRHSIEKLQRAYEQNPSRRDWQKILKQLDIKK